MAKKKKQSADKFQEFVKSQKEANGISTVARAMYNQKLIGTNPEGRTLNSGY